MTNLPRPFPFWFPYQVIAGFMLQIAIWGGVVYCLLRCF